MTRAISLAVFAALVIALFAMPSVEPGRLGAFQVGRVLEAPEWKDPSLGWQEQLRVGDQLTRGDKDAQQVVAVSDTSVRLLTGDENEPEANVSLVTLAGESVTVEGRPLWRSLIEMTGEAPEGEALPLRITGALFQISMELRPKELDPKLFMDMLDSALRRVRAIGGDEDFELDVTRDFGNDGEPGVGFTAQLRPAVSRGGDIPLTNWDDRGGLSLELTDHSTGATARAVIENYKVGNPLVLLPPLVAIFLAILFRKPVIALTAGVFVGSFLVSWGQSPEIGSTLIDGTTRVFTYFFWEELIEKTRYDLVFFVVFMLAMVGIITRAGGIRGLMDKIAGIANSARNTQVATWIMGLAIFFDDYANTILVGTTMRPLTDKYKIAREKLAYIVDSTAAPVAGISVFSTWIAFEVSTFSAQLPDAGMAASEGYAVFFQTLPYRFYCILTLFFVGLLVFTGRDFGPMLKAERRARNGKVLRDGAKPMVSNAATELQSDESVTPWARVAILPLIGFVAGTIFFIMLGGGAFSGEIDLLSIRGITAVLGDGSGSEPLMYGSAIGLGIAIIAALGVRLAPAKILVAAWSSLRSMGIALAILYLAWMVGRACGDLGTADYLSVMLGNVNPLVLPVALFMLSALVAFSTGSSWSTMTILLPLVVALSFTLGQSLNPAESGIDPRAYGTLLMVISIGAVLEGAIFGDHCSPISDTTVMSSIASASDHIDHVRTQMPYALVTMGVSITFGYFPAVFFGSPDRPWLPFVCLAIAMGALFTIVRRYGRRAEDDPEDAAAGPA
jgi:Na+/H+ antiporter NhaC